MNIVTKLINDRNRTGDAGSGFVVFDGLCNLLSQADRLSELNGVRMFAYCSPSDHFPEFIPYTTICSPVGGVEDPEPYEITLSIEVWDCGVHCCIYADDSEILDISPVYQSADMSTIRSFLITANRNPAAPRALAATEEWSARVFAV
jgi:hypothetical protein